MFGKEKAGGSLGIYIHIPYGAADHLLSLIDLMPFRSNPSSDIVCRP